MSALVTLTTEFQEQEPAVAILKGVLLSRCPGVQIIDLSHEIPREGIVEGALFLASAIPYFPPGTVHLVDVAPGPAPIVISTHRQFIVCPDNGIASLVVENGDQAVAIDIPDTLRSTQGQIMFGRDIFAPASAHLAAGKAVEELGVSHDIENTLDFPKPTRPSQHAIQGEIIHINRFGSLVTNIHSSFIESDHVGKVTVGSIELPGISSSYADVAHGCPLAIIGGDGFLEVAYNGDRADTRLEIGKGIFVTLALVERGAG